MQVTEIHSRFGDKEIILSFQKRGSGPLGNGKEPVFATLLFCDLSHQAVRLAISNFAKVSVCLLADIKFNRQGLSFKASFILLISFNQVSNIF